MVLHRTRDLEDEWNKRMEVGKREYGFLRAAAGGDRHGAGESTPPKETQQHTSLHSHRATPHHTTSHYAQQMEIQMVEGGWTKARRTTSEAESESNGLGTE